jgi:hypothetical protein
MSLVSSTAHAGIVVVSDSGSIAGFNMTNVRISGGIATILMIRR